MPVALCLPEYSSGGAAHDQHGSSVPSTMYCSCVSSSSAVGTKSLRTFPINGVIARQLCLNAIPAQIGKRDYSGEIQAKAGRPVSVTVLNLCADHHACIGDLGLLKTG